MNPRVLRLDAPTVEALLGVDEAYRTGAWLTDGARMHLFSMVDSAEQAARAAGETIDRIGTTVAALEDAAAAIVPGTVVQTEDGGFSRWPDWATTTAASTIGSMTDATAEGLKNAARASGDDVAGRIATRMGPAGAAIGVIPAISWVLRSCVVVLVRGDGSVCGFSVRTGRLPKVRTAADDPPLLRRRARLRYRNSLSEMECGQARRFSCPLRRSSSL